MNRKEGGGGGGQHGRGKGADVHARRLKHACKILTGAGLPLDQEDGGHAGDHNTGCSSVIGGDRIGRQEDPGLDGGDAGAGRDGIKGKGILPPAEGD